MRIIISVLCGYIIGRFLAENVENPFIAIPLGILLIIIINAILFYLF